jgi:hypothetical protein
MAFISCGNLQNRCRFFAFGCVRQEVGQSCSHAVVQWCKRAVSKN